MEERFAYLTKLRKQRLDSLSYFYDNLPENPKELFTEFQTQMNEMIDYTMELEKTLKELIKPKNI